MKCVIIGAGNVATHISLALQNNGVKILQVYSRSETSAVKLATLLAVPHCSNIYDISKEGDFYLYSVKDSALESVIKKINIPTALHIHTAGSMSMTVFNKTHINYGVLYPLQTFSINKKINIAEIPFFIEANTRENEERIIQIVKKLSDKWYLLNSENRMMMHLAAVFACNFTNYMYVLASQITQEVNIDFKVMLPLIIETTNKLNVLTPIEAQTGPAIRKDDITIAKHVELLKNNKDLQNIYVTLSKLIEQNHTIR